jgi:hypothetical protein
MSLLQNANPILSDVRAACITWLTVLYSAETLPTLFCYSASFALAVESTAADVKESFWEMKRVPKML